MNDNRGGIWAVAGGSAALFWAGAFIFGFPGVMGAYWQERFQVGRGAIGLTLFFVLAGVGSFMFLVGRWQERYGPKTMITLGAALCGLDILLIGYARHLFVLYLWSFLMGMTSSFIYIPSLTVVQKWFPEKRGLVTGIVNFTFGLSAAIMSPLFGMMFKSLGYTSMCVILAGVAFFVGIIGARLTESPPRKPVLKESDHKTSGCPPVQLRSSLTLNESLRTRSFWFFWFTWALQGAAGIAMVTLSTQFGLSIGLNLTQAVIILTTFNITSGVSRLVMGHLSDTISRKFLMGITFYGAGLSYFILPWTAGIWLPALLASVIGFAFGTLFAVSAPLAADCFGMKHFGSIFGMLFIAYGFVAGPIGPFLSGHLLDVTQGNFRVVFLYLGIFCIISGTLINFVVPPPRPGQSSSPAIP